MSEIAKTRPPHTEEVRSKIAATLKGQKLPPEVTAKISASLVTFYQNNSRKPVTEENRKKLSEAGKKRLDLGEMANRARLRTGHIVTEETRCKISEGLKGRKLSPENIAKIVASKRGTKHSVETRLKMSKAHLGRVMSEETRRKISETRLRNLEEKTTD